jgi:hypothetical protein
MERAQRDEVCPGALERQGTAYDVHNVARGADPLAEVVGEHRHGSPLSTEVEFVTVHAQIIANVADHPPRNIARMPGKGDQAIRLEGVGVMAMAAAGANRLTSKLSQAAVNLSAIP